ncbi:tryptophan 7-halogenase [Kordiimonas aestuarii]|uniref:tryptophan 7-halogenase n=1 Tax=Kordiimonas aestuarii TaxID=1005925 RepID=UPI0021D2D21A|nr:tryptophan 7-halogenase [Kordiimonas aestuarii]
MFSEEQQTRKTIAIIGGGPAASATALSFLGAVRTLRQPAWPEHYAVKIFCESPTSDPRIGESLPPAATPCLRDMALEHLLGPESPHLSCPGSTSVWGGQTPGHNDFMLDVMGRGYHLDRAYFDTQLLSEALKAGAMLHQGWRLVGAQELYDGASLDFSTPDNTRHTLKADFVVDASGLPAAFARRIGVFRNTLDEVVFLCATFDIDPGDSMPARTLIEAVEDGWWYAARLPAGRAIVTFCTDPALIKEKGLRTPDRWREGLQKTRWLKDQLPASVTLTDEVRLTARAAPSTLLSATYGDAWLAVGDAASSYDPISSAGITKALLHAQSAGVALAEKLLRGRHEKLQAYGRRIRRDFEDYARVRAHLYASETRFADAVFWQRRRGHATTYDKKAS